MRYRVDKARRSALAVCECGFRALRGDYEQALVALVAHERVAHRSDADALSGLGQWRHRQRRAGKGGPS